jgi:hypothetical protein
VKGFEYDGSTEIARVGIGGWQDFMGVIDAGGQHVRVPVSALLFGPS